MGHTEKEYFCERCGYGTFDKSRFTRHLSRKRPCKPKVSRQSLRVLRTQRGIEEPGAVKKRVLERKTPTCEYCGRTFASAQSKWNHKKRCPGRAAYEAERARQQLVKDVVEGRHHLALDKPEVMRVVQRDLDQPDQHHGLLGFVRAFLRAGVLRPADLPRFEAPDGGGWLQGYQTLLRCWQRNLESLTVVLIRPGEHPKAFARRENAFMDAQQDLLDLLEQTGDVNPNHLELPEQVEHRLDEAQDVDWQTRAEDFFTQCIDRDARLEETTESSKTTQ